MGYRIGSLNIESKRHSTVEIGRDLFGLIFDIIHDQNLSVFAFQEVLSQLEFESLKRNFPFGWTGHFESSGKGAHSRYGFAFFWNSNILKECSKNQLPQVFNYYKSEVHLNREPLFGRFAPVGIGAFREYRLLDIHLTSGDPRQKSAECEALFGTIYNEADTHRFGNNRPAITVALGDFNFSIAECNLIATKAAQFNGLPYITTVLDKMTHIQDQKYNSSLDHFSYNASKYSDQVINVWRIDAVDKYFRGNFEAYTKKISDHVPIIIEFI